MSGSKPVSCDAVPVTSVTRTDSAPREKRRGAWICTELIQSWLVLESTERSPATRSSLAAARSAKSSRFHARYPVHPQAARQTVYSGPCSIGAWMHAGEAGKRCGRQADEEGECDITLGGVGGGVPVLSAVDDPRTVKMRHGSARETLLPTRRRDPRPNAAHGQRLTRDQRVTGTRAQAFRDGFGRALLEERGLPGGFAKVRGFRKP